MVLAPLGVSHFIASSGITRSCTLRASLGPKVTSANRASYYEPAGRYNTPTIYTYNLARARRFAKNWLARAVYVGSHTAHLAAHIELHPAVYTARSRLSTDHLSDPTNSVSSGEFGSIRGAGDPRIGPMALKIVFSVEVSESPAGAEPPSASAGPRIQRTPHSHRPKRTFFGGNLPFCFRVCRIWPR